MVSCLVSLPSTALAAASTSEATVFIEVSGEITITTSDTARLTGDVVERRSVKIRSGTGFVVAPLGYVVTNHHVVNNVAFPATRAGRTLQVTVAVERIDVVYPRGSGNVEPRRFSALLIAGDPVLDVAVLYIGGQDLPYAPLGDSDAIQRGERITAIGYPMGRQVDLGKSGNEDLAPETTASAGTVSSLRADSANDLRSIQIDAAVNPGNSGGPLVDREGYVQGIIHTRLNGANNIAFAIPINLVKQFLSMNGLEQILPTRFLSLGPLQAPEGKALRIRLPEGLDDSSPSRLQVASVAAPDQLFIRMDRITSPWTSEQLEQALLRGNVFEQFSGAALTNEVGTSREGRRVRRGWATGAVPGSDARLKMEYAIFDLPREKIVARYVGPAEQVAANQSVLRASLASLEAEPMLTAEIARPLADVWTPLGPSAMLDAPGLSVPAGWIVVPGGPSNCSVPRPADMSWSASPAGDFTVSFRFAWWRAGPVTLNDAMAACAMGVTRTGDSAYATRGDFLGVAYGVEGMIVSLGERGIAQFEVLAPAGKFEFVRDLFTAWATSLELKVH